ncbi:T-cell-specific surface glycoprotein CD28 [Rhinoderma darwinii]|uniref:T-cell-specific surface glycoprotein CD28 n=1 Tax=Rhinoderma darwinii TaxID=43563 RepID=UPI003F6708D7
MSGIGELPPPRYNLTPPPLLTQLPSYVKKEEEEAQVYGVKLTINATMVLWMIWSVGLIMLAQNIGLFVEGENGARGVYDSCRLMEKLVSSDASPVKNRYTFYAHNNNSLTYFHNFNGTSKEFRVSLFRGINKTSSVCEGSINATRLPFDCENCRVVPSASNVTFHLRSLHESDTDIYFFCKEVMYPPPYICECDEGTIVHVKEHILHKEVVEIRKLPLGLLITLGCMTAYGLIITTAFIYIMINRRRKRIQQSEYINVVPRRPKNHKPYIPYAASAVYPHTR